jgi:hypothetical protein
MGLRWVSGTLNSGSCRRAVRHVLHLADGSDADAGENRTLVRPQPVLWLRATPSSGGGERCPGASGGHHHCTALWCWCGQLCSRCALNDCGEERNLQRKHLKRVQAF